MAQLLTAGEILATNKKLKYFGGIILVKAFMRLIRLKSLNTIYSKISHLPALDFNRKAFSELGITYQISEEDMNKIPLTGPYIIIANHPTGGGEAMILTHIFLENRPDFKFMANFMLTRIAPLKEHLLPVNPFEDRKDAFSSMSGIKNTLIHLQSGAGLGIFPAGEVSSFQKSRKCITDKEWNPAIIKLIKKAKVPVIPVFVEAKNSGLFYFIGKIHPLMRTLRLPAELLNKRNKPFRIKIGNPICIGDQDFFKDIDEYGQFLRFKTYSLSEKLKSSNYLRENTSKQPVISENSFVIIEKEVNQLSRENLLCELEEYKVFHAASSQIPNVLLEIGRLREVTYREIGEGTGKSIDTDNYDLFYHHLFIWDQTAKCIVGAYRMAKGKDVFSEKGIEGFYIKSLFEINDKMFPVLEKTIELGRSFIRKDYQKKPLSLFLLWKGILYFLIKNPEYRYLLGPVSISNSFSDLAKGIIIEFLNQNYLHPTISGYITPKMPFNPHFPDYCPIEIILNYIGSDVTKLDKIVNDIEPEHKIPVLLKKYLKQHAKVLSANVDPSFNYCLDILMLLDLKEVPPEVIESLSKEISEAIIAKD